MLGLDSADVIGLYSIKALHPAADTATLLDTACGWQFVLPVQLWLELARTFLALQQPEDAQFCVQQAKSRAPASPATQYTEGRVLQVCLCREVATLVLLGLCLLRRLHW